MNLALTSSAGLSVCFGAGSTRCVVDDDGPRLELAVPLLAGAPAETLPLTGDGPPEVESRGDLVIVRSATLTAGAAAVPTDAHHLEDAAFALYQQLLEATAGQHLYRIWNYVPAINAEVDGLENYRAFNLGRWRAFENFSTAPDAHRVPAASAVGTPQGPLALTFIAGHAAVRYFENPHQVPAYQYPATYGPKPPRFCRGARVEADPENQGDGIAGFLSGTASIQGHETRGHGDLAAQIAVTAENIRTMEAAMDFAGHPARYRCYLRHAADLEPARHLLADVLGSKLDPDTPFLQADICRHDLLVEIEAAYGHPPPRGALRAP